MPQFEQAAVALHQLLAGVHVVGGFHQLAHGLAQALDGQGHVVLHEVGLADAEFLPVAPLAVAAAEALAAGLGSLRVQFVADLLDALEERLGLGQQFVHELHRFALPQRGEQALAGFRVPQTVQREAELAAAHAQADVLGGDVLDRVRLVEDEEIVLEEDAALLLLVHAAEQREEERVVQHQHVGGKDALARALEEAEAVVLREVRLVAANLRRAQAALGADLRPDLRVRLQLEVGAAAVLRFLGPRGDALELLHLGRAEELVGVLQGLVQAAGAEVVRAALEHRVVEPHRRRQRAEHGVEHRQVFLRELLLEGDGVGADDGLLLLREREEDGRDEVGEGLANAGAGLDDEVLALGQRASDGHGHLLLLGAELEVAGLGEQAGGRKDFRDLLDEVGAGPGGLVFNGGNHRRADYGKRGAREAREKAGSWPANDANLRE